MGRARLLDITRLVSRAGLPPTGVDRVEFAYLDGFLRDGGAGVWGLARTALGFVLLDHAGLTAFRDAVRARDFPYPDILSRLNRNLSPAARRGQSFVRWRAVARSRAHRLGALLRRMPAEFVYYNVGHSNLTEQVLDTVAAHEGARIAVLVHDTIPLDHPDFQRFGSAPRFRKMLTVATRHADHFVCGTQAVAADIERHVGSAMTRPGIVVAPLGVTPPRPAPETLPPGLMPLRPFFVMLGTIEPRKNHALLLDIWDDWGPGAPELLIVGRRGWRCEDVFARLDEGVPHVREVQGLGDGAVAALLERAHGLLFPSLAEGYGLPPVEAAAMGVPVICSDLAACREVMRDWPVYADPSDRYGWEKQIKRLLHESGPTRWPPMTPPGWAAHLEAVTSATGAGT